LIAWLGGTRTNLKESELAYDENTAGLLRLVCDVRFALGDDGKRMQEELIKFCAEMRKDAERYRKVRRGQHWSVINGIGDVLRAEKLDAAVDAMPAVGAA
jgi:hypothetical protein